jgi:hypothetical protein
VYGNTGLVWDWFMANPEIAPALEAIEFRPDLSRCSFPESG